MKRLALLFTLCIALPVALLAADSPFAGSWKLNLEKSKMGAMTPKSLTRTVAPDGDNLKYVFAGQAADGSAINYSFTVKLGGDPAEVTGTGAPMGADHVALKLANPRMITGALMKGGKDLAKVKTTVSDDGKTVTVATEGTSADGKPMVLTSVYDKQ